MLQGKFQSENFQKDKEIWNLQVVDQVNSWVSQHSPIVYKLVFLQDHQEFSLNQDEMAPFYH